MNDKRVETLSLNGPFLHSGLIYPLPLCPPPPPNKKQQQQQLCNKESNLSFTPGFLQLQTTLIQGWGDLQPLNKIGLYMNELVAGAHNLERATSMRSCHGVFTDPFIFRTVLMRILNIF